MNESRRMLQHFLAGLAYRFQKALRGAPAGFSEFNAGSKTRTPHELVWHLSGLMGYASTMFHGARYQPPRLDSFDEEIDRFHATLQALHDDFGNPDLTASISDEQFLHGPLSDAMTHVGQIALLRRLAGSPVASENFIFAKISPANLTRHQADPVHPDLDWTADLGHRPPGEHARDS